MKRYSLSEREALLADIEEFLLMGQQGEGLGIEGVAREAIDESNH